MSIAAPTAALLLSHLPGALTVEGAAMPPHTFSALVTSQPLPHGAARALVSTMFLEETEPAAGHQDLAGVQP